jgi:hypothetical protein
MSNSQGLLSYPSPACGGGWPRAVAKRPGGGFLRSGPHPARFRSPPSPPAGRDKEASQRFAGPVLCRGPGEACHSLSPRTGGRGSRPPRTGGSGESPPANRGLGGVDPRKMRGGGAPVSAAILDVRTFLAKVRRLPARHPDKLAPARAHLRLFKSPAPCFRAWNGGSCPLHPGGFRHPSLPPRPAIQGSRS